MTGPRIIERLGEGAGPPEKIGYLCSMLPECEVNPWLSNVRLLGDLVPKVFLGFSSHDQQTPVTDGGHPEKLLTET